ncbi:ADP-ribosylglycohydrolase family protein [Breznakia pachnodae]|uniref:ADP-ribosylglycohydrolase n=1 Tax=Breznakia pachnodae TaxID=265178 RepID=A0ABU0E4H8_9FIRM|nr:ADP-ribosylglycohydrolase family protein [Breznakia pachnodae]MDQ0361797.1 ADP-ribosylglycohydrolase [Breznakia pachnodae]
MKQHKILGALYGAAYGDSLGAVSEFCTRKEIVDAFPNGLTDYAQSISRITAGITPGQVTDDFGSSCYVMESILKYKGVFNRDIAIEALLKWSTDEEVFGKYAGMNTKEAMVRLRDGIVINEMDKQRHFAGKNTNGGAMKVNPVALLAQGNHDQTIVYTLDLCWPTHYNSAAASGACAIACAINEAQNPSATVNTIIDKAIQGAKRSRQQLDSEGYYAFGPYVENRIQQAVILSENCKNNDDIIRVLDEEIGTGIQVQGSVAAVFAIIAATKGSFADAIYCAVNAGGDTDTMASMIGAILGGYHGMEVIPKTAIEKINSINSNLNLKNIVYSYTELVGKEE